jgi:Fe-S oxidoreductase/nitrate reductase gamma subunit
MHDMLPAREIFRNFPAFLVVVFYLIALVALGIFAFGCWMRVRKYCTGRPARRLKFLFESLGRTAWTIGAHVRLRRRDLLAGWAHAAIFWGFVSLFVGSLIIAVDQDVLRHLNPALQFWRGAFYLWFSLILDLMGLAFLIGLCLMAVRRWRFGLPQLDYSRADGRPRPQKLGYERDDKIFLWGLFCIGATGFLLKGLRICADKPPFEVWSVVGWQIARGYEALGLSRAAASTLHPYLWWPHVLMALGFIAYIPYSKAIHMLTGMANFFLRDPLAGKRLPAVAGDGDGMAYETLADFTWKELLDLDACTKCGRCHVACPARAGGWPLSPRDLILDFREHANATLGSWRQLRHCGTGDENHWVIGTVVQPETLWACTTCLACVEVCPVGIEHVPLVVQLRRKLVEEGRFDPNLQKVLGRLGQFGNSFGESADGRAKWAQGLPFKIKDARKEPVEFLWFVGDFASYDPRLAEITRSVATIFHQAGLDFGILYESEGNAGNDVRRVGEEGLFRLLAENNLAVLGKARFKEIVTTDPHSYNTIKFEYAELGANYRIRHYTEVIHDLMNTGRLRVTKPLDTIVTYHDPCHLSRYTQVTDAPRAILKALGVRLVEMERNRANSFCCGAGGGRIWMTNSGTAERPSEQRIKEALQIPGLKYFVTACPKDFTMYSEAVKSTGNVARLQVTDLIELVEEAVDLKSPVYRKRSAETF